MQHAHRARRAFPTSGRSLPLLCSVVLLPLALACRAKPTPDETVAVAGPQQDQPGPGRAPQPEADVAIGAPAPPCYPDCETHEPDAGAVDLPYVPEDYSRETPSAEACPGGPEPETVSFDPKDGIIDIALSSTHVLWSTREGVYR